MINYAGEEIVFNGCPGCAYAKHEFSLPCGIAFQNERFTLSQDWELPIDGFFVVCPTERHVEFFNDLTQNERNEMFDIVNKTISILKSHNICQTFNIIIQEKKGVHLHVWIYPQHEWIKTKFGNSMAKVKEIFDYAKQNLRTPENLEKIKQTSNLLKTEINKI